MSPLPMEDPQSLNPSIMPHCKPQPSVELIPSRQGSLAYPFSSSEGKFGHRRSHQSILSDVDQYERLSVSSLCSTATITQGHFDFPAIRFEETDIEVDFGVYTIEGATLARSKLVAALYPRALPADAHITVSPCSKPPKEGAPPSKINCGQCLLEDALDIEAGQPEHPKDHPPRMAANYAVKDSKVVGPTCEAAHEILFKPTQPCPRSKGVAMTDIMEMTEVHMLDADAQVMRDLPSGLRLIDILLQFTGGESIKFPVRIACDCGTISRAKLACEIANAVYIYHKTVSKIPMSKLQLLSLASIDEGRSSWTPRFALIETV
ncbi:hypothetical protein FPV67DRAFT_877118 [Lyophyllum atratum]|nr:hypothetical protein FPV67DRAFT_877118 [Lyophyllum atratum]